MKVCRRAKLGEWEGWVRFAGQGGFFKIFDDRGIFGWSPLCISECNSDTVFLHKDTAMLTPSKVDYSYCKSDLESRF